MLHGRIKQMGAETVLADRPESPGPALRPTREADSFDHMDVQMRRFSSSLHQLSEESRRFCSDTETVHRLARLLQDAIGSSRAGRR